MVVTGAAASLKLPLLITELVCSPANAHGPQPLEAATGAAAAARYTSGARAGSAGAAVAAGRRKAEEAEQEEVAERAGAGAGAGGIMVQRLAALHMDDSPQLQVCLCVARGCNEGLRSLGGVGAAHTCAYGVARGGGGGMRFLKASNTRGVAGCGYCSQAAAAAVGPRVAGLQEIWWPPRGFNSRARAQQLDAARRAGAGAAASPYADSESDTELYEMYGSIDSDDEGGAPYGNGGGGSGWVRRPPPFVAAEGLYWEMPNCAGVTVRAAQLQHRVPCWGYVFAESVMPPQAAAVPGARRRKVRVAGAFAAPLPVGTSPDDAAA